MYFCHPKHSELAEHLQKYKGRVVLRGDNVKDAISRLLGMAEKQTMQFPRTIIQHAGCSQKAEATSDGMHPSLGKQFIRLSVGRFVVGTSVRRHNRARQWGKK